MDKENLIKRINDLDDNKFTKFSNIAIQILDLLGSEINPLSLDNSITERLKNARNAKGLTQVQLAKKLGVAKSVIAGAETKRGISKSLAVKLADFFNTDIDYWF